MSDGLVPRALRDAIAELLRPIVDDAALGITADAAVAVIEAHTEPQWDGWHDEMLFRFLSEPRPAP